MKLLVCLSFILCLHVWSDDRMSMRWQELNRLIQQEMKILLSVERKSPELNYRLFELQSEKLKLIHEKDNQIFLKSVESGLRKEKESFFSNTRKYYQIVKEFGQKQLAQNPRRKAEILYTLAINSRDFGKDQLVEIYLKQVLAERVIAQGIKHHAQTALADFYYNEKRWADAISFYVEVIKKTDDDWLTKHLYNYAWCLLKDRKFDSAITHLLLSFEKSKEGKYIDVSSQVLEHLGTFYIYAGNPLKAFEFYKKNVAKPASYISHLGTKSAEKGLIKDAEVLHREAITFAIKENNPEIIENAFHGLLDFYRQQLRYSEHEKITQTLVAYYLEKSQQKVPVYRKLDTVEKLRNVSGVLQIQLSKDISQSHAAFNNVHLNLILSYYRHLVLLDPSLKSEYAYYEGETYFSVKKYHEAAQAYKSSVLSAINSKQIQISKKALNSLLALLGEERLNPKEMKEYLVFTYSEYLRTFPRDEKSEQIYKRLFSIYLEQFEYQQAAGLVLAFHQNYPEQKSLQQEMMLQVMDGLVKAKHTTFLAEKVNHFRSGELGFSPEAILKMEEALASLLFSEYQQYAIKGKGQEAIDGLSRIFENKVFSKRIKFKSAWLIGIISLEMAATKDAFQWLVKSFQFMDQNEKYQKRKDILSISEKLYQLQDFSRSHDLALLTLKADCQVRDDLSEKFFEVAFLTAVVEQNSLGAYGVIKEASNCLKHLGVSEEALAQLFDYHLGRRDFYQFKRFYYQLSSSEKEKYQELYIQALVGWYWSAPTFHIASEIKSELALSQHSLAKSWSKQYLAMETILKRIDGFKAEKIWDEEHFNAPAFNQRLQAKLKQLSEIKTSGDLLMKDFQVDLTLPLIHHLSLLMSQTAREIRELSPLGLPEEMKKDFFSSMEKIATKVLSGSLAYQARVQEMLKNHVSFNPYQRHLTAIEQFELPIFSQVTGVTMDRIKKD